MAKYLISTTEVYRVDHENEAATMIENAKKDNRFILAKSTTELKEIKSKGEVIDTYYKVSLVKSFTDIKNPEFQASVDYSLTEYPKSAEEDE